MPYLRHTCAIVAIVGFWLINAQAQPAADSKFENYDAVVKGAKELEGLFRLHIKDEKVYAEIRPDQFDRSFLLPIAVARGAGMGGHTLNFDEQWVVIFKRVGDRVHLVRRNVRFQAKPGTPVARAVETTYTDSILLSLRIVTIQPARQSVIINLNDIFMSDFGQVGMGTFDPGRSTWFKVKAFPRNLELEVAATFTSRTGDDNVIDARGKTVVIHYGLTPLPESGYQPRLADDRVGHFLSVVKDFSTDAQDSNFVRHVNRWRLERAEPVDPKNLNRLSAPKKKIIFWIEKSVPEEYRASVREGILEWNKAFEKIGFRDAIEVRQQENEDFDPEDINYNTFRWITTDLGYAMGPSRANPLTGEILDADIVFDASMVRFWRQEYQLLVSPNAPASTLEAAKRGWNLMPQDPAAARAASAGWNEPMRQPQNRAIDLAARHGMCQCGAHMKLELSMGALVMAEQGKIGPGDKVPDELLQQAIKEVVMHEVGHTLGLRHNFKASTMLKHDQLHDTTITRKQGLTGSVMDYTPVNLAPKGVKQGDYFTQTLGPYDYWAIEYAYKPLSGDTMGEAEKLREIAQRGASAGLDYATDEDLANPDPLNNLWDLGADPMRFAQDRMLLAEDLFKTLADKVGDKGEGYQKVRQAFSLLLNQYGNAAFLVAQFIGGEEYHRDHRGDPNGRDSLVAVKGDKQRQALTFLKEHILSDKSFAFPPSLLRRLGADRWYHWGNESAVTNGVEFQVQSRVLRIQKVVLSNILSGATLIRVQESALKAEGAEKPLQLSEVFRTLTDGIFGELPGDPGKPAVTSSALRRNLQREYVTSLSNISLGKAGTVPPDARSLARAHLKEIGGRLDLSLKAPPKPGSDETVRAHWDESRERIARVLQASVVVEP